VAPILLYHRIDGENTDSRYRVSVPDFRTQMQWLYEQGYSAITISMLLDVLLYGGELPEKPIVISFDDGHLSVYENAFPIMDELGFPGVFYVVANRIYNAPDFVHVEEIGTLVDAGWEIGSHGYTHLDVTKNHASANYEIGQSKADLQAALGVEINTFAYPYGEIDPFTARIVSNSRYQGGMGLGSSITHTWNTIYYLHRIEVHGGFTLDQFIALITPD
jgi:peptidoglycan/xylan/chitin deacetylase (PgdA/CDA1 family)